MSMPHSSLGSQVARAAKWRTQTNPVGCKAVIPYLEEVLRQRKMRLPRTDQLKEEIQQIEEALQLLSISTSDQQGWMPLMKQHFAIADSGLLKEDYAGVMTAAIEKYDLVEPPFREDGRLVTYGVEEDEEDQEDQEMEEPSLISSATAASSFPSSSTSFATTSAATSSSSHHTHMPLNSLYMQFMQSAKWTTRDSPPVRNLAMFALIEEAMRQRRMRSQQTNELKEEIRLLQRAHGRLTADKGDNEGWQVLAQPPFQTTESGLLKVDYDRLLKEATLKFNLVPPPNSQIFRDDDGEEQAGSEEEEKEEDEEMEAVDASRSTATVTVSTSSLCTQLKGVHPRVDSFGRPRITLALLEEAIRIRQKKYHDSSNKKQLKAEIAELMKVHFMWSSEQPEDANAWQLMQQQRFNTYESCIPHVDHDRILQALIKKYQLTEPVAAPSSAALSSSSSSSSSTLSSATILYIQVQSASTIGFVQEPQHDNRQRGVAILAIIEEAIRLRKAIQQPTSEQQRQIAQLQEVHQRFLVNISDWEGWKILREPTLLMVESGIPQMNYDRVIRAVIKKHKMRLPRELKARAKPLHPGCQCRGVCGAGKPSPSPSLLTLATQEGISKYLDVLAKLPDPGLVNQIASVSEIFDCAHISRASLALIEEAIRLREAISPQTEALTREITRLKEVHQRFSDPLIVDRAVTWNLMQPDFLTPESMLPRQNFDRVMREVIQKFRLNFEQHLRVPYDEMEEEDDDDEEEEEEEEEERCRDEDQKMDESNLTPFNRALASSTS